jgi:hypothetical protein
MIGGGFTSRCVFVYADTKRRLVPYPSAEVPASFKSMEKDLVHDLEIISTLRGEIKLSKAAHKFGEEWYIDHFGTHNAELSNSRFAGYLARKQTHIHKIAMVLSVADAGAQQLVVSKRHLEAASEIATSLEADMPRVFSQIGLIGITKHVDEVLQLLKSFRRLERKDLARHTFNLMGPDELGKSLQSLIETGYIKVTNENSKIYITYTGPD